MPFQGRSVDAEICILNESNTIIQTKEKIDYTIVLTKLLVDGFYDGQGKDTRKRP
jgi:hypothetical protein